MEQKNYTTLVIFPVGLFFFLIIIIFNPLLIVIVKNYTNAKTDSFQELPDT